MPHINDILTSKIKKEEKIEDTVYCSVCKRWEDNEGNPIDEMNKNDNDEYYD